MDKKILNHIETNQELFRFWISRNERLQSSADILKPIIPIFQELNTGVNIEGCPDCLIDMLRWAIKELKESKDVPKKKDNGLDSK